MTEKLELVEKFQLFGVQHLLVLTLITALCVVSFKLGRGEHSERWNLLAGLFFGLFALSLWTFKLSDGIDLDIDLPLQLCDLVFLLCLAAFIRPKPIFVTLVTYWGLGGTVQALLTPDVASAFPSSEFLIFFTGHSSIVLAAFFLLGRAPHKDLAGWPGLKTSFQGLLCYTVVTMLVNFSFDLNYGYLRAKPAGASVLDLMGPWPIYIFGGLGLAFAIFAIIAVLLNLLPLSKPEQKVDSP